MAVKKTERKPAVSKKEKPLASPEFLSAMDRYLFGKGRNYKCYKKFGAHLTKVNGKEGMHFAVWAPHAKSVSVVCDRNNWTAGVNKMELLETSGIYECFIEGMGYGEIYKYAIETANGEICVSWCPTCHFYKYTQCIFVI